MKERRYDIDWLRNFGILLLFPFHAARVFDIFEPNYVKNAVWSAGIFFSDPHPGLSNALSLFIFYSGYWFMPLLFWLAGSSSWYALKKRDGSQYLKERVSRLLIPLLFGLFFVVPIQGYMAKLMQGYTGGFIQYLLGYFVDFHDLSGYFGSFTPAHLWFILYLFIISLVVLPLLLWIRNRIIKSSDTGNSFAFMDGLSKPAVFLLLFIPLTVTEALPDIGGKNPFFYAAIFILGYLAVADGRMQKTINRLRLPALIALPACLVLLTVMVFSWGFGMYSDFSVQQIGMAFLRNFTLMLTLTVLLGYANKFLNRDSKALPYMSRAAFPVYILHQSVMMVAAFFVVQWALPVWGKFLLIIVLSFGATMGIYEFLVRRIGFMRFLFGVK